MAMSVASIVKKYKTNAKNNAANYVDGVRGVTENPMAKAIAAIPKYVEGVRRAVDEGLLERGLAGVSLAQWKEAAEKVGGRRYADGIDKGEAKYAAHMAVFKPEQDRIASDVQAMPSVTLNDRLARMVEMARRTAELKGISKGRR